MRSQLLVGRRNGVMGSEAKTDFKENDQEGGAFGPGEPNDESFEAICEGDAFLTSDRRGRFDCGADLVAAAMVDAGHRCNK